MMKFEYFSQLKETSLAAAAATATAAAYRLVHMSLLIKREMTRKQSYNKSIHEFEFFETRFLSDESHQCSAMTFVVRCLVFLRSRSLGHNMCIHMCICLFIQYISIYACVSALLRFLLFVYYHHRCSRWMDDSVRLDCTSTSLIELWIIDTSIIAHTIAEPTEILFHLIQITCKHHLHHPFKMLAIGKYCCPSSHGKCVYLCFDSYKSHLETKLLTRTPILIVWHTFLTTFHVHFSHSLTNTINMRKLMVFMGYDLAKCTHIWTLCLWNNHSYSSISLIHSTSSICIYLVTFSRVLSIFSHESACISASWHSNFPLLFE